MTYNQKNNFYPLGPLENLFREVYDKFDGDGATGAVFRIRGNILPDFMAQALYYLQKRHPKLRCCLAFNTAGIPCFKLLDSCSPIPLFFRYASSDDLRWQDVAQTVLYPPIDVHSGPLLRVLVLEHSRSGITDLFMGFHHVILDMASLNPFVHELLSTYEMIYNHQQLPDDILQLPMIIGQTLPLTASLPKKVRSFVSLLGFSLRRRWGGWWTKLPSSSSETYSPLSERYVLSEEKLKQIKKQCFKHRVTLTGAIFAASLLALKNITTGYKKRFVCRFPINMRGPAGYSVDTEHLGCLVSGFMKIYSLESEVKFWDIARKGIVDLKMFIKDQGPLMAVNLSRFLKIRANSPPPLRDTLSIDNLGVLNVKPQYGDLELLEMSPITRRRFVGVSLMVFFVVIDGRLNITFDGADLHKDFFMNFQNEFFALINNQILEPSSK